MKYCHRCESAKPNEEFSPQTSHCKVCSRETSKARYHKRKANMFLANGRDDIALFKQRYMCTSAKMRARKKDIPFDIVPSDIIIPTHCPILGIPIILNADKVCVPGSPSLDRLLPKLGYVKHNIVVISHRANMLKSDATLEESQRLTAWLQFRVGEVKW